MSEPAKLPVAERYGECENAQCYSRLCHFIPRKPVWVLDGRRLCNECYRGELRRRADAIPGYRDLPIRRQETRFEWTESP